MDNDVKALVERLARFSGRARLNVDPPAPGDWYALLADALDEAAAEITRLAAALSARASSDAEKRDAVLVEAAEVVREQARPYAEASRDPSRDRLSRSLNAMAEREHDEIISAILSLRTKASDHE